MYQAFNYNDQLALSMNIANQKKYYQSLFRPKKHLGSGSFGRVEKCISKIDGKTYAVKLLEFVQEVHLDSIRSQAQAMMRAKSDYTVELLDHFYDENLCAYIFVMSYYSKGSLTNVLNKNWTKLDILCFMYQICQAFLSFNKKGACWHLDLKPDNILVKADGQYLICDFGCAKLVDNINTSKMLSISMNRGGGTTLFAAPELILNYSGSRFSDVWSLGIMLYEILYRKHPLQKKLENKSYTEIIRMFTEDKIQIDYPPIKGMEQIIGICKAILQPFKRLEWEQLKRIIYQCIGLPLKVEIVSNIQKFISYAQNVSKVALGLVYCLSKNQKCIAKFGIEKETQKIISSAKAYVSLLYREVENSIVAKEFDKNVSKSDVMLYYIFPQVQNNYTIQEKQRLAHLRSVAETFCYEQYNANANVSFMNIKMNFEADVEEFLTMFRQKGLDKYNLTPLSEWEKIVKICSFIVRTNKQKYPGLEYADRDVIQKFAHEIVYE